MGPPLICQYGGGWKIRGNVSKSGGKIAGRQGQACVFERSQNLEEFKTAVGILTNQLMDEGWEKSVLVGGAVHMELEKRIKSLPTQMVEALDYIRETTGQRKVDR